MANITTHAEHGSTATSGQHAPVKRNTRLSTETKASVKTSELVAYVLAVIGVLIAAAVVGDGDSGLRDGDPFTADKAWLFVVILTVGYLVSRGLAKSGSRDYYDDDSR